MTLCSPLNRRLQNIATLSTYIFISFKQITLKLGSFTNFVPIFISWKKPWKGLLAGSLNSTVLSAAGAKIREQVDANALKCFTTSKMSMTLGSQCPLPRFLLKGGGICSQARHWVCAVSSCTVKPFCRRQLAMQVSWNNRNIYERKSSLPTGFFGTSTWRQFHIYFGYTNMASLTMRTQSSPIRQSDTPQTLFISFLKMYKIREYTYFCFALCGSKFDSNWLAHGDHGPFWYKRFPELSFRIPACWVSDHYVLCDIRTLCWRHW